MKCKQCNEEGEFYKADKVCKKCRKANRRIRYLKNKASELSKIKDYYSKNKDNILGYNKIYREENSKEISEQRARYYKINKNIICSKVSNYRKKNRGKVNSLRAKYRANQLKATPTWANHDIIKRKYRTANILSKLNRKDYHVDHIIPLQGTNVCGLHVENNLQIITKEENLRKGNRI